MSGDLPVVMLGTVAGVPTGRMLTALDTVQRRLPRPAALVGGIAVAARLGTMERATADIDAVVDAPDEPPSVQLLLDTGAAAPHPLAQLRDRRWHQGGPHRYLRGAERCVPRSTRAR